MSQRVVENSRSGVRAAIWGWLVWYFTPSSGFLFSVLNGNIFSTLDPGNIQAFIVGTAAALGITGGAGAYYRNMRSPVESEPEYRPEPAQPATRPYVAPQVTKPDAHQAPSIVKTRPQVDYDPVRVQNSKYFQTHELECHCGNCEFIGMSDFTMQVADSVRERFGPIKVQSAYRCPAHNATIKGASRNSWHKQGAAIDMRPLANGVTPEMVYDFLDQEYPAQFGIGAYGSFCHFDDRPAPYYARKPSPESDWYQSEMSDFQLATA